MEADILPEGTTTFQLLGGVGNVGNAEGEGGLRLCQAGLDEDTHGRGGLLGEG